MLKPFFKVRVSMSPTRKFWNRKKHVTYRLLAEGIFGKRIDRESVGYSFQGSSSAKRFAAFNALDIAKMSFLPSCTTSTNAFGCNPSREKYEEDSDIQDLDMSFSALEEKVLEQYTFAKIKILPRGVTVIDYAYMIH